MGGVLLAGITFISLSYTEREHAHTYCTLKSRPPTLSLSIPSTVK